MDAARAWAALDAALPPDLRDDLRPAASAAALDAAERVLGLALPPEARAAYGVHDGQGGDAPGVVAGLRLLPLADAAAEWRKWQDVTSDPDLAEMSVEADPGVRATYMNPAWVPIADDGAGNGLAIDLDPSEGGTLGQIVTFGPDEPARRVVAPSLPALLAALASAYETGRVVRDGDEFRLDAPGGLFGPDPFG